MRADLNITNLVFIIFKKYNKLKDTCDKYFIYVILFKNPAPAN